jgi:hypothetical protein
LLFEKSVKNTQNRSKPWAVVDAKWMKMAEFEGQ